jgi:hypothetical protein
MAAKARPALEAVKATETPEPIDFRDGSRGETWNTDAPMALRLLRVRRDLRTEELFKHFDLGRGGSFDAFSIHKLARTVEDVLNSHGLFSDWRTTKWFRNGNCTHVEGVYTITCVDADGEVVEYPAVGEGVDGGDKGTGKALSTARKNAMIAAFNLGVGVDIEEEQPDAEPEEPRSQSTVQQTTQDPTFPINFMGKVEPVPLSQCAAWVTRLISTMNAQMFENFRNANLQVLTDIRTAHADIGNRIAIAMHQRKQALGIAEQQAAE